MSNILGVESARHAGETLGLPCLADRPNSVLNTRYPSPDRPLTGTGPIPR